VNEVDCQIEVDAVNQSVFAEKLKVLIDGKGRGCLVETELLHIEVCSNQAQEYETLLDIGPQDLSIGEEQFRNAVVDLIIKLRDSGFSTKTFHEFSEPLPCNGENKC